MKVTIPAHLFTGTQPRILEINKINQFQHLAARIFLKSPPDMCESILGLIRLPAQIDIRKLSFLWKLINLPPESTAKQIFIQRLFLFITSKAKQGIGIVSDLYFVLQKYNLLHHLYKYIETFEFLDKNPWKFIIREKVYTSERMELENR